MALLLHLRLPKWQLMPVKKLVITYTATVSNDAVVGGKGNSNNAKLTYTNKINTHDSPAAPSTNTIEDSAVMYSFGIKVVKTAENGTTALPGVCLTCTVKPRREKRLL